MNSNFIIDYADCAEFRDYIKNNIPLLTTLTTLILKTTQKNNFTSDCVDYADFRDYIKIT